MAERKGSEEEWRTTACIFNFVPPTESHCPDCLKPLCSTPNTLTYLLFLFFWTCLMPPAAQCPIDADVQYYFYWFNTDAYNKRPLLPTTTWPSMHLFVEDIHRGCFRFESLDVLAWWSIKSKIMFCLYHAQRSHVQAYHWFSTTNNWCH